MNKLQDYQTTNHVVYSCKYHVIWCPKYRRPVLANGIDARLKEILSNIAEEHKAVILEMEVIPDHVHLLLDIHPQLGVHLLIKAMKGVSSRQLRQEFPDLCKRLPTLWSHSYFITTVGGAPLEVIKQYIESQKFVRGING